MINWFLYFMRAIAEHIYDNILQRAKDIGLTPRLT